MFNFKGKVAVISGASSGLGRSMAKAFASVGADLVILARRIDRLEELQKELSNVRVLPIKCDVTKTEDIENASKKAINPSATLLIKFIVWAFKEFGASSDQPKNLPRT